MKNPLVIKFREKIIKSEISQHDKVFHKSLLKVLLLCQSNLVKLQPKRVNPSVNRQNVELPRSLGTKSPHKLPFFQKLSKNAISTCNQGTLSEREGSVPLTS
jgi:hypothetical protein